MTVDFSQLEQQNGLPPGMLSAVMQQESGGNPNAISPKGAVGAFQFMPQTAQQYGIDPTNPDQSAQAAATMLGQLHQKYNGDIPSTLAGYNWGQGNVDRKGLQNAPPETQNYIQSIMGKIGNAIVPSAQAAEMPAPPPRFVLDGQSQTATQIPTPPPGFVLDGQTTQQPSLMDQAGRQLGLTARYATNFATGVPTMLGDATNIAINGVTSGLNRFAGTSIPPLQMPSQLVQQGLTNLGLPQSQGSLENVVGDISKAVASTGGSVALGNAAPELAPLAQNPMMQARAAMGASGASGVTRELGGGPLAQTAAGLAGGYLGTRQPFTSPPQVTSNDIYNKAAQSYQYANQNGGLATPQYTNKFLDEVENTIPPQTLAGKATTGSNDLTDLLSRWQVLRNQPLTLNSIDEMDKGLTDLINTKGIEDGQITPIGRQLLQIKNILRDTALNPEEGDMVGGTQGFDAWKQGIDQWAQASKLSELEYIMNRAKMMPQPTTALQTGFRNLALQLNDNPRGYTPEEVDAINNAAKVGLGTQFFKVFGSRLVPLMATGLGGTIGTGLGGPMGGLAGSAIGGTAGYLGSEASGNMAAQMQMNKANQAAQLVANRFAPPPQNMFYPGTLGTMYGMQQ